MNNPRCGGPVPMLLAIALIAFGTAAAAQVNVTVDVTGDEVPGGTVTATATVEITDGSTLQTFAWTQEEGAPAMLAGANTATVMATLGALPAYKDHLFDLLAEPPVDEEDLPENVPLPEGEFPGGLQDRFQVVGLNPFSLEEAGLVELEVTVTTTSGAYTATAEIHTALPWKVATGLLNVPVGNPVLLHGKDQMAYDWAMAPPAGSAATLTDATTQNPEFVADVAGLYMVTVTEEEGDGLGAKQVVTLPIYAGTWRGVIIGQDAEGRPVADGACTGCHSGFAPDLFTPWKDTGHAEIFTQRLNTSSFWRESCYQCHTVGFDPEVANGGIDDAPDYDAFLGSGLVGNPDPGNWTAVLDQFPATAQLANVQCENCHGPQSGSEAHGPNDPMGDPRKSLSANVCATCHGEPLRHARFQQWQISPHANYELAIERSQSGSCSRCHTANGFLAWLPILLDDDPATDPTASIEVTWTEDEAHPQTCATCHDPHSTGTTSGIPTDATTRISGDTPPLIAGFTAENVGRGAICMTCHNSRRGARSDSLFPSIYGTAEASRAPHGSAQADMVMGYNAYFTGKVDNNPHASPSVLPDVCVTCHMERTPPPAVLSYNEGGSNHTFRPRTDICGDCHAFEDASAVQAATTASLMVLEQKIEEAILELIGDQIAAGNTVDLDGDAVITNVADIAEIQIEESRGRQAIVVTFTDGRVIGPAGMNNVHAVPPMGDPFDIFDVANPNLVKAGWNYWLVYNDGSKGVHNFPYASAAIDNSLAALEQQAPSCLEDADTTCLNQDRFRVEVDWTTALGETGSGQVVPFGSDDSGLFYFFTANNWEMLIKVLNGCNQPPPLDKYWVFYAATTDVGFTVTVTDTQANVVKTYTNPLGQPANAVTDTAAFATCP